MAKTNYRSVDEYIEAQRAEVRPALREVGRAINAAVPDGEEVISYQIPAVRSNGWVVYYSAAKNHYSLSQPPPFAAFEEFADELARYKRSKSAVQFPYDEPVPVDLIRRMAEFQVAQNEKQLSEKQLNEMKGKRSAGKG